jgi:hypothetical protein
MEFANPAALFGLLGLIPIFLLGFLRIRPRRVAVPSLTVWRMLPERPPPLREMKRPRFTLQLILIAAGFAAGVLAIAGPSLLFHRNEPLSAVVALDTRPRMLTRHADGRTSFDRALDEIRRMAGELEADDRILLFAQQQTLLRLESGPSIDLSGLRAGSAGSFEETLARAHEAGPKFFAITDRPREGPGEKILVGDPRALNTGIADATPDGFVRLIHTGPPREARVSIDGAERSVRLETGSTTLLAGRPIREIKLLEDDSLAEDNVAVASMAPGRGELTVGYSGSRRHDSMIRAMQKLPGARVVPGDAEVRFIVEEPAEDPARLNNAFVILPMERMAALPAKPAFSDHPLLKGVPLTLIAPKKARPAVGSTPLIEAGGVAIAALDEARHVLTLGFDPYEMDVMDRAWLPILMQNFYERAREAALAPGPKFLRLGADAPVLGPGVNLLDETQSMNAGEYRVPRSYGLSRGDRKVRNAAFPLDAILLGTALLCLGLAYLKDPLNRRRSGGNLLKE